MRIEKNGTEIVFDRRTERTLRQLTQALCVLAAQKPVYKITVAELSAQANVSRGTFYLHFSDIYDMYDKVEGYVLGNIEMYFKDYLDTFGEKAYDGFLRKTVQYIEEEKDLFKMLFSMQSFRARLTACLRKFYIEVWEKFYGKKLEEDKWQYLLAYHTDGSIACLEKWLNGDDSYTAEDLLNLTLMIDEGFDKMVESNSL